MIKRFGNWCFITHGHEMLEAEKGNYVLFADHERELAAAQAKLSRFESAQMPEYPNFYARGEIRKQDYDALRTFAAAQTVRVEELQTMFGLARVLCLVNGCPAETFDAAIAEALKEPKT